MPLVVGTDTYISLTDAEAYIADYGDEGSVVVEADLRKATLAIDRLYGGRFSGYITSPTQDLLFPRNGDLTIPKAVAHATVELAVLLNGGTNPYAAPEPALTEEQVEVDVLKQVRKFAGGGYAADPLHKITTILAPVLSGSAGLSMISVVRA